MGNFLSGPCNNRRIAQQVVEAGAASNLPTTPTTPQPVTHGQLVAAHPPIRHSAENRGRRAATIVLTPAVATLLPPQPANPQSSTESPAGPELIERPLMHRTESIVIVRRVVIAEVLSARDADAASRLPQ